MVYNMIAGLKLFLLVSGFMEEVLIYKVAGRTKSATTCLPVLAGGGSGLPDPVPAGTKTRSTRAGAESSACTFISLFSAR